MITRDSEAQVKEEYCQTYKCSKHGFEKSCRYPWFERSRSSSSCSSKNLEEELGRKKSVVDSR
jgi:hypothetical protein